MRRVLEIVDLVVDECVERGLEVRDRDPLVAVDLHDLAAGKPVGRFRTRHIVGVALVHRLQSRLELARDEPERSRADKFGDLLRRRRRRDPCRHDERHGGGGLAERRQHVTEGRLQLESERASIDRGEFASRRHQRNAHRIARAPALQRGDHVFGSDRRAVVEFQPGSQLERIGQAIARNLEAIDHLRLVVQLAVHREQRVVDVVAVVARRPRRHHQRVGHTQRGVHHRANDAALALRKGQPRRGVGKGGGAAKFHQMTTAQFHSHDAPPDFVSAGGI